MSMYNHKPCTTSRRLISLSMLYIFEGLSWPWSYGSWIYDYLCNQCLSPLMLWVRILIRARCTTLCDKVCQWLATSRGFSAVSPTNKTDHHDITEILLKVALSTIKQTNKHIWYSITLHKIVKKILSMIMFYTNNASVYKRIQNTTSLFVKVVQIVNCNTLDICIIWIILSLGILSKAGLRRCRTQCCSL